MSDKRARPKIQKPKTEDELTEIKSLLMRVQADFDNYRKRTQKEKEDFALFLNGDLILRTLPVLDNFQLALKHLPKELEKNDWVKGIWQIERQLEQVLADEGAQKIPTVGQKFDPYVHEAVEEVPSPAPEGEITDEVLAGYRLGDKILRHAKVKVSKDKKINKGEKNE